MEHGWVAAVNVASRRRRRRKLQTGSISQWQFHSDRKVQLRWSCGAGCQSHKPVPSGFEHGVWPCSAFTLIFPLLFRRVSHLKGKTNKLCHPFLICQRAHLSCPDTYIMRSRCTRSNLWPSTSDETFINGFSEVFHIPSYWCKEQTISLETLSFATSSCSKDANCSSPGFTDWKQFKLKIFKM